MSLTKRTAAGKEISLKIELTAGLEQEVALDFDVSVEDRWEWYFIVPVLEGLDATVSIDVQDYTYISVGAKVYTVQDDVLAQKKWKALSETVTGPNASLGTRLAIREINKLAVKVKKLRAKGEDVKEILEQIEEYKEQLPTVNIDGVDYSIEQLEEALGAEDVSAAFDEVFSAEDETEAQTGMEQLMDRYKEMLEQECDWVEIYNRPVTDNEFLVSIVAVRVNLNFVVSANINIALGADMEYQVGKRYSFWLHILDGKSGSSEMDLIDERFAFQFYVMGTLGIKAGIKMELSVGIISTRIASIGANVEFGAYLKLYGYFIYYFEKLRPANTEAWNTTEEMMGALYIDFGLYVTVKFKAQVFFNTFKYEPTLYDGEFPLLTAGVQQSVYGFSYSPAEDEVLAVRDEDLNSMNGITMQIPAIYRTMKRIDLVTGEKSEGEYDAGKFIVTFDNSAFSINNEGEIDVDVPEGARYITGNMRIVWKNDKLSFSKYDIDITVPVVWTNMSESELNEKFTASVAVGNSVDGYTTVWSKQYSKVDVFDLPEEEELLELIDYYSYEAEDGTNLKYDSIEGYQEEATGLSLTTDRTFFFDITRKEYTVNVTGVQEADGTAVTRTYTAKYGETIDLSELQLTGSSNNETRQYTRFYCLTEPGEEPENSDVPLKFTVNMSYAGKYGTEHTFKANYHDTALTATYIFYGIGNNVPDVTINFAPGTAPYYEGLADYVRQYGGEKATIVTTSPKQAVSETSVVYSVICKIDEEKEKYTLSFNSMGGSTVDPQTYLEDSVILRPDDPERAGYTFAGWYLEENCTNAFDFSSNMPGRDLTLYAKWNVNTYNLIFSTNTGTAPASRQIKYGDKYGELPVLSDENQRFIGWFTAASGGTQVTADTVFNQAADITVYAHWENKKTLTQSDFGGQDGMPQVTTYNKGQQAFKLTVSADGLTADDFTVYYKLESGIDEWVTTPPTDAGSYLVRVYRSADDEYLAVDLVLNNNSTALQINKADPTKPNKPVLSVNDWVISVTNGFTFADEWEEVTYECWLLLSSASSYDDNAYTTQTITKANSSGAKINSITIPNDCRSGNLLSANVTATVPETKNYNSVKTGTYIFFDSKGNTSDTPFLNLSQTFEGSQAYVQSTVAPLNFKLSAASVSDLQVGSAGDSTDADASVSMLLSPEEVVMNRGKTFDVTLKTDNAEDIWGFLAAVDYDPDTLELLGWTYGDVFTEAQFTMQEDTAKAPYRLLATLDEIGTVPSEGGLITLQFRVKETAEEKATAVSLETLELVSDTEQLASAAGSDMRMVVDETAPVIIGITDGGVYSGDTVVTVDEENLASVTVNGKETEVTDGKFTLKPADGEQTVVATDKAGNSVTVTVTVNEPEGTAQTGDASNPYLWIALLAVSGGAFGITIFRLGRRKRM